MWLKAKHAIWDGKRRIKVGDVFEAVDDQGERLIRLVAAEPAAPPEKTSAAGDGQMTVAQLTAAILEIDPQKPLKGLKKTELEEILTGLQAAKKE